MGKKQTTGYVRSLRPISIALAIGFCLFGVPASAETGIFQTLGNAVERASPYHASQPAVLSPGMELVFGAKKYAVFGTDPCPSDPMDTSGRRDFECLQMTPGIAKSVVLVPVGSKTPLHAGVAITQTGQAVTIELTSLLYPDGRAQSFTPPVIGRPGE